MAGVGLQAILTHPSGGRLTCRAKTGRLAASVVLAFVAAWLGVGCGTNRRTPSTTHTLGWSLSRRPTASLSTIASRAPAARSATTREAPDHDGDADAHHSAAFYDRDDSAVRNYLHAPSLRERRSIVVLVERYYVAAATDDGTRACELVAKTLTAAMLQEYGSTRGRTTGGGCAAVVGALLRRAFQWSSADVAALRVIDVRVGGDTGLALIDVRSEDRQILLEREHGDWRLAALFDSEVT
jgi:hypothetical protein